MDIDEALGIRAQAMLDQARDLYVEALKKAMELLESRRAQALLREEIRTVEKNLIPEARFKLIEVE